MTTWHEPDQVPECNAGEMIPVILQRGGKVFGGWYCNAYPLIDDDDSLDGIYDDEGFRLSTGFCEKRVHSDFDDYYEFAAIHDLECWAYMPKARAWQ